VEQQEDKMHHHDELFDMHFAEQHMLARESCYLEPKLTTYQLIICKQIAWHSVVRRSRAQVLITSSFLTLYDINRQ